MKQPELDQLIAEAKDAFSLQTEYAIDIAKDANKILELKALAQRLPELSHLSQYQQMRALGIGVKKLNELKRMNSYV